MTQSVQLILVGIGSALFIAIYHGRPQHDVADRRAIPSWRNYRWVDLYLKVSSIAVTVLSLLGEPPWLLQIRAIPNAQWVGLVVAAAGLSLFYFSIRALDKNFSPAHDSKLPQTLVTHGPYRWVRHPIYTANLLIMVGLFLLSRSLWLIVNLAILVVFYLRTTRIEEKALRQEFPEYVEYARRTGRFIPRPRHRTDDDPEH